MMTQAWTEPINEAIIL